MSLVTVCYDFAVLRLNFHEWLLIITYATEKVRECKFSTFLPTSKLGISKTFFILENTLMKNIIHIILVNLPHKFRLYIEKTFHRHCVKSVRIWRFSGPYFLFWWRLYLRDSDAGVFLWTKQNFLGQLFHRTSLVNYF